MASITLFLIIYFTLPLISFIPYPGLWIKRLSEWKLAVALQSSLSACFLPLFSLTPLSMPRISLPPVSLPPASQPPALLSIFLPRPISLPPESYQSASCVYVRTDVSELELDVLGPGVEPALLSA